MSRKTLLIVAANAALAVLGCVALRAASKCVAGRDMRPHPAVAQRRIIKAVHEGRARLVRVKWVDGRPVGVFECKPDK